MKKLFYISLCLLSAVFTSCADQEDIELVQHQDITLEVNMQSVYDEFNMTNDIKDRIRDEKKGIGVKTYIYNADGNLVDSLASHQFNLNNAHFELKNFAEGEYTFVVIETLVYEERKWQPNVWTCKGVENLSTLEICQNQGRYSWFIDAIGLATEKVVVKKGDKGINIKPKAIGSLVNCFFFDADKTQFVNAGFGINSKFVSYRLDPSLSDSDRYNVDLTESAKFNLRGYTTVDGEDNFYFTLYFLENSIDYTYCGQKQSDVSTRMWTVYTPETVKLKNGETYYSGCYFKENGSRMSKYFGEKDGFLKWYNENKPAPSLIPDVYTKWGAKVSDVQSAMSGYTMTTGNTGKAVLQSSGNYAIAYAGKGKESLIGYIFTSATVGLVETDVFYPKANTTLNALKTELDGKYTMVNNVDGSYLYMSDDYSTFIILMPFDDGSGWCVGFVDVAYVSSAGVNAYIAERKLQLPKQTQPGRTETGAGEPCVLRQERLMKADVALPAAGAEGMPSMLKAQILK